MSEPITNLVNQPLSHGFWGSLFTRGTLGGAILASVAWIVNVMWGVGKQKVEKWDKAAEDVPALRQHVDDQIILVNRRVDDSYKALDGKIDTVIQLLSNQSDRVAR